MSSRIKAVAAAVAAVAAATMAGCGSPIPSHPYSTGGTMQPTKNGDGAVRHDLSPLTDRIPALSDATQATWSAGTLGDGRVPGPSTYWIDAVVTLTPSSADQLRDSLDLEATTERPSLAGALESATPSGTLLRGADLDRHFSTSAWNSTAYLAQDGSTLILQIVGGN